MTTDAEHVAEHQAEHKVLEAMESTLTINEEAEAAKNEANQAFKGE